MRLLVSVARGGLALALAICAAPAAAAPQRLPFSFDPALPAKPAQTSASIAAAEAILPPLPSTLQTLQSGAVTLWFSPETAAALSRTGASMGAPAAPWPSAPGVCAAHDAFSVPSVASLEASPSPSAACHTVVQSVVDDLAASAPSCREVEEPERYVRRLPSAEVTLGTTADVAGLVGVAGEAFTHAPPVPAGLLPSDFATTTRTILKKVRADALASRASDARAAYARAKSALATQPACFVNGTALASAIDALDAELATTTSSLSTLVQSGKTEAAHEALCLAAKSHVRVTSSLPTLTRDERRFAAFWLGGIFWRMRGGGLIPLGSTQSARLYYLQRPFTVIGDFAGGQDGADAAMQIYLAIFEGWGTWMDMGRTPGQEDQYDDLVNMTRRGERQVHAAAQLLAQRGYDPTPLTEGGLAMGPCYFYAYDPLGDFRWADALGAPYGPFLEWPTALGEFCTGASIALGLADTLLEGRATTGPPSVNLCANRACGDDGCGGSCGSCGAGLTCQSGACVGASSSSCDGGDCPQVAPAAPPSSGETRVAVAPAIDPASTAGESGCATGPGGAARSGRLSLTIFLALALLGRARARISAGSRPSPRSRRTRRSWRPCPSSPDRTSMGRE